MARAVSEKVGRGPCPCCGSPVTYRRSSGGMLTHKCDDCDSSGYAEPGGAAYKKRMAAMTQTAAKDEPKPNPKDKENPEPIEGAGLPFREIHLAKKPRNSVFDLGDV